MSITSPVNDTAHAFGSFASATSCSAGDRGSGVGVSASGVGLPADAAGSGVVLARCIASTANHPPTAAARRTPATAAPMPIARRLRRPRAFERRVAAIVTPPVVPGASVES
ncbi:hypothetical protein QE367_002454 [Microbacterium paludicola]|uniref:Uncharacterized protein n=1 Tax=Microbacterium paludicola TaxID=300019 RepID=A0ABU1I2Y4_9MICO|nr:hypothetical protein [Microbacterium paludicola]MDR6168250.1 hypothetical protein [Microbacterium paludicola]